LPPLIQVYLGLTQLPWSRGRRTRPHIPLGRVQDHFTQVAKNRRLVLL